MQSNTLRLNFCYLKVIQILHPHYRPKIVGHTLKNKQKNMYVYIHEIIRVIIMKVKMKMKNRSHRYGRNKPKYRHGHIWSKCKNSLSMMMLLFINQHLSNICCLVDSWKSYATRRLSWKKALLIKKACRSNDFLWLENRFLKVVLRKPK